MTTKKDETPDAKSASDDWARIATNTKKSAANPEDITDWVVVVDDSSTSLNVIAGVLKGLNLGIHTFRSASAALKYLREISEEEFKKIVMVFSDMDMPNMNGLQFLTEIRSDGRLKDMHFVIISGQVDKNTIAQFAQMKIDGYIVKPFKAQSIIDRVTHVLSAQAKSKKSA